jgi:hypothetical protein
MSCTGIVRLFKIFAKTGRIGETQRGPLVWGEAAGKPDGQGLADQES